MGHLGSLVGPTRAITVSPHLNGPSSPKDAYERLLGGSEINLLIPTTNSYRMAR